MEEEEHTDRKQQLARLYQRFSNIKKYFNEDDTDNINQVIGSNSPESCLSYLTDLEKKRDPVLDQNHLTRLIDFYTRVFSNMPLGKHCHNESYARMLVRFAELKALQDVNEAEANFNVATAHSQSFAFVHVAHAQFDVHLILQNALEVDAKPKEQLVAALQSMQAGKTAICLEDKENFPCENLFFIFQVPVVPFSIPENDDDIHKKVPKSSSMSVTRGLSRFVFSPLHSDAPNLFKMQTNCVFYLFFCFVFYFLSDKRLVQTGLRDLEFVNSNSPESCWTYLMSLEKRGNPHTNVSLLNKLKDCYSKVFSRLPIRQYSKNTSYARILVRYAELKGIEDPDEAQDHFIVARSNCKGFAFVHIAHAQFEVSQGNLVKATSILHKALALNAKPAELLETAMRNLTSGEKQLVPPMEDDPQSVERNKPASKEPDAEWKIPSLLTRQVSPEVLVYQVLDHKKQLFAVKYVNLEEADAQTIESYKNEIEHLNHLQQYSDQIIKLYDYEITNSYIYMLMECGNLDLNTWLRNRKTVNPLERKFYWKNMLEAVHTIHKHGIVHSDLKPANFVIVNASLKLIDFGIANRIQPDVTSIMKDSQVGTLNYMPPEAIKDTSSQPGQARSKISPKGDVWSLGCILYCMTYGKTPFQSITNQIAKLQAIIDPSHKIEFPDIAEKDLLDVLKRCLVRNPRERISIAELLEHQYLQLKPQSSPEPERPSDKDLKRILTDLAALQSPNSIVRAANNLAKMCSSGRKLDVTECAKSSS
uniref:Dual specificity protein kinase TTK n=1 Tax=Xiphophorus couchianus TaxID=32473 RepID=A0A3B5MGC9_9TELE